MMMIYGLNKVIIQLSNEIIDNFSLKLSMKRTLIKILSIKSTIKKYFKTIKQKYKNSGYFKIMIASTFEL